MLPELFTAASAAGVSDFDYAMIFTKLINFR